MVMTSATRGYDSRISTRMRTPAEVVTTKGNGYDLRPVLVDYRQLVFCGSVCNISDGTEHDPDRINVVA